MTYFLYTSPAGGSVLVLCSSYIKKKTLFVFTFVKNKTKSFLRNLTNEMIDTMLSIISDATDEDVVFVPQDPNADDPFGIPEEKDLVWTLGHVAVHTTSSSEESAALALTLARGLVPEGRSRYEVPW